MPENRKKSNKPISGYYVDGNTVRKYEAVPEEEHRKRQLTEEERERRRRKRQRQAMALRQEQKKNRLYMAFLIASVSAVLISCVFYLGMQSQLKSVNSEISTLKSDLSTIVNENLAMEERMNSAVDLAEIYNKAINEFGMTVITEGQIYYYSNENQDYVKQYKQIPSEN